MDSVDCSPLDHSKCSMFEIYVFKAFAFNVISQVAFNPSHVKIHLHDENYHWLVSLIESKDSITCIVHSHFVK